MGTRCLCRRFVKVAIHIFSWAMYSPWCDPCRRRLVSGAKRTSYICWSGRGNGFVVSMLGRGELMALGCSCSLSCDEVPMWNKRPNVWTAMHSLCCSVEERRSRYCAVYISDAFAMLAEAMESLAYPSSMLPVPPPKTNRQFLNHFVRTTCRAAMNSLCLV